MVLLLIFLICFSASVIGGYLRYWRRCNYKTRVRCLWHYGCGYHSFLSGCTVLSMTTYSVIKNKCSGESHVEQKTGLPLALGAAAGGLLGKSMFSLISSLSPDKNKVGAVQAACLLAVTLGTLIYTIYKARIKTCHISNPVACIGIGVFLGILSSFLGIGGGPINLVVLFFFFSMTTKVAAENSLYIIFFSQIASLLSSLVTKSVPDFQLITLVFMVVGGIAGGAAGGKSIKNRRQNRGQIVYRINGFNYLYQYLQYY